MESCKRIVDLSSILPLFGRIIVNEDVELKLIEYYEYLQTNESTTISRFTSYLVNKLNFDNTEHVYSDILKFYKDSIYTNYVLSFLNNLNIELYRKIGTDFINVKFSKISEYDKLNNVLLVEFEVENGI